MYLDRFSGTDTISKQRADLCGSTRLANGSVREDPMRVELRRYPNRRYYDAARSQHLTLEDIFRLICDGHQVRISESKTGEDITVRVLVQLILDQAPSKLAVLPAELLHQIIRSNGSLLGEFLDKYFNHALTAFIASQWEFDRYFRQALGLSNTEKNPRPALPGQSQPFFAPNWAAMMEPFARAFLADGADSANVATDVDQDAEESDMRKTVEELKQEVVALRKELKNDQNGRATGFQPAGGNQDEHGQNC